MALPNRLTRIVIERLRGLRHADIGPLGDVNLFVGKNNSGKTTVLESVLRLADRVRGQPEWFDHQTLLQHWTLFRGEGAWTEQVLFRPVSGAVELTVEAVMDGTSFTAGTSWSPSAGLTEFLPTDPLPALLSRVGAFHPADGRDQRLEARLWPEALRSRWDKVLLRELKTVFAVDAEQIHLLNGRLMLLFPEFGLPADSLGDGARSAMRCLLLLAATRGAPFLVEEPECHQHPGSLKRFARALVSLARANGVQLFITTHSDECLRAFVDACEADPSTPSEAVMFHLARAEDGIVKTTRIQPSVLRRLEDRDIDVRSLDLYE